MTNFFGKIRHKLLANNKVTKYLMYAVGEIILVVIGILLALQVNNWNESRKTKEREIKTLKELQVALQISQNNLQKLILNNERWQAYNVKIKDYLENKKPYDESLDICFGTYFWTGKAQFTTAAYSKLENEGPDLITNKDLRENIIYIFDDYFSQIKTEHEQWEKDYLAEIIYPEHVKLFRKYFPDTTNVFFDEYAKPVDYAALLENDKFINIISENISLRRYSLAYKRQLVAQIDNLNNAIDKEVMRLED